MRLDLCFFDVGVDGSPPHDIDDVTASLAAQLAFELVYALPEK